MKARDLIRTLVLGMLAFTVTGMCIAAVSRTRDAANKATCAEYLKQLGISVHNYLSANRDVFPGATVEAPGLAPEQRLSWLVAVRPYLESKSPFGRMPHDRPWDAEENRFAALWRIKSLECPAFP